MAVAIVPARADERRLRPDARQKFGADGVFAAVMGNDQNIRQKRVVGKLFQNIRRRVAGKQNRLIRNANFQNERVVVFLSAAAVQEPDASFVEGMQLVYKKFSAALGKLGLTPLEEEGKFDPNLHNAIMSEVKEGVESGTILDVFQKGYKVGDKIVRHSMVKVSE